MHFTPGHTACYISDYKFKYLCDIPQDVAVGLVKEKYPEVFMSSHVQAKDLTVNEDYHTDADQNGWENKRFIIVAVSGNDMMAIYNHDGNFSLYSK